MGKTRYYVGCVRMNSKTPYQCARITLEESVTRGAATIDSFLLKSLSWGTENNNNNNNNSFIPAHLSPSGEHAHGLALADRVVTSFYLIFFLYFFFPPPSRRVILSRLPVFVLLLRLSW